MVKLSNKEIMNKFKDTEYGRKTTKRLYVSLIITSILLAVCFIMYFIFPFSRDFINNIEGIFLNVLFAVTIVLIVVTCYFSGKRDGALEQYKRGSKKLK